MKLNCMCTIFLCRKPCEVRINNYMKNCLHIWRANHDIQPTLSPHAVIEYILSYVTKGQKGMGIQMERACKEEKMAIWILNNLCDLLVMFS